jgi:hypothetical protein
MRSGWRALAFVIYDIYALSCGLLLVLLHGTPFAVWRLMLAAMFTAYAAELVPDQYAKIALADLATRLFGDAAASLTRTRGRRKPK